MKDNKKVTRGAGPDPDALILFNVFKYSFITLYLIKIDSIFLNEYKIKLFKNLILINNNYSNLLLLDNNKLKESINNILKEYFNTLFL